MPIKPEVPPVQLTPDDVEAYHRDGVICVRGLYSRHWVDEITKALDEICASPSPFGGGGKFRADVFTYMLFDRVRDFVLTGPSAYIAQQVFGSRKVNFFYDQIFVKEEMTPDPTPWHHDATFWPIEGDRITSLWTSADPVTTESSGLEFIAGSHRWGRRFKAVGVGGIVLSTEPLEEIPDIDAYRSTYRVLSWDLEPGDALLFNGLTLHGSRGNRSTQRKRRAITTRWTGDDVIYRPRGRQMPIPWRHGIEAGDPLGGFMFPQVLPEVDAAAIARRLEGPIYPDPELVRQTMAQMATAERVPVPIR